MHPLILLIVVIGALAFVSWYKRAPKALRQRALIYGGVGLALVLLLTGRLSPVFALLGALIPLAHRALGAWRIAQGLRGLGGALGGNRQSTPDGKSEIHTRFLHMQLDHDSGAIGGQVIAGAFAGHELGALSLDQLVTLYRECAADPQSIRVLETFLDHAHGDRWRARATSAGHHEISAMDAARAREVLGVDATADRDDIIAAHRRLMQKMHPDRGGSTYLAAEINRAKAVLLGE